jgi:hypothetical protein
MALGSMITPTCTGSEPPARATGGDPPAMANNNLARTRMEVVEQEMGLRCKTSAPSLDLLIIEVFSVRICILRA